MSASPKSRIRIPESALDELAMVEAWDWSEGIGLNELLDWINDLAARFRPDDVDESARASQEFTARTFRHYQTLGCIDTPRRVGKRAVYGFRHYLQALLLRKLLWERLPSARIAELMRGRTAEEYKALLLEGIEIVPLKGSASGVEKVRPATLWNRHVLDEGVELNLARDRRPLSLEEVDGIAAAVRDALRNDGRERK